MLNKQRGICLMTVCFEDFHPYHNDVVVNAFGHDNCALKIENHG